MKGQATARAARPGEPGYRRVAAALRADILDGRWAPEERMPTESELEVEFGVGRQTVRRAYLDLVHEGLVHRTAGRGTFVTPQLRYRRAFDTIDDLLALSQDTDIVVLDPLVGTFDAVAAAQLQLTTRLMYGIRYLRRHQGVVLCQTKVHLPVELGALLEDEEAFGRPGSRGTTTVLGALTARGVRVLAAEQATTARAADEATAEALGCAVGTPLLHAERLYVDADGRLVEWEVSDYLPENYTYRVHLGRAPAGC